MSSDLLAGGEKPLLIKTNTCPACRTAVALLDSVDLAYTVVTDSDPGYEDTVNRYGVRHVPTLVLHPEGNWRTLVGTEAIRGFIKG